jgi:SAM-dependent methyltransferase
MAEAAASGTRAELLARWYDLDLRDDPGDLDLYLALAARNGGPILELAAGSGRIAIALAVAGHEVVGVDLDPAMLGRARAAWDRAGRRTGRRRIGSLELVEADLLEVQLGARFGLVVLALNSLLLLGTAERQQAALAAMARHLRPDGRAAPTTSPSTTAACCSNGSARMRRAGGAWPSWPRRAMTRPRRSWS